MNSSSDDDHFLDLLQSDLDHIEARVSESAQKIEVALKPFVGSPLCEETKTLVVSALMEAFQEEPRAADEKS